MKKSLMFLVACAVCAAAFARPPVPEACVGKTLYLGRLPGVEQEILAELFIWLVNERTGTSIKIKPIADSHASHAALGKAEIDIYLEGTAVTLRDILEQDAPWIGDSSWQAIRKEYEKRYNLIWLEPWGPGPSGIDTPLEAVPVVRRDTLKKFPALSRLLNKMGGVVDDQAMANLLAESSRKTVKEATKTFLRQKKLI